MLREILAVAAERAGRVATRAAELEEAARRAPFPPSFRAAVGGPGLAVVAEVKRRSPSAGVLAAALDPARQAEAYAAGGAAAVSVLTEPRFFDGSLEDLEAVGRHVELPLLRKDFILHPAQVWEARAAGAAAVLLIVAALDDTLLRRLLATVDEAGIEALVEVHDERELARALEAGATLVGVNNRDLATFRTDLTVAERLAAEFPPEVQRVAESGISGVAAARRMAAAGYDAVLVGEALVRAADPAATIRELRAAT